MWDVLLCCINFPHRVYQSWSAWFKAVANVLWMFPCWSCRYTWLQVALGTRSVCTWPGCWAPHSPRDEVRGLVLPFREGSLSASSSFRCSASWDSAFSWGAVKPCTFLFFGFCMLAWLRISEAFFKGIMCWFSLKSCAFVTILVN